MQSVILATAKGSLVTLAVATLAGTGVYSQSGGNLKLSAVAFISAAAGEVLVQLVPAGAMSKINEVLTGKVAGANRV